MSTRRIRKDEEVAHTVGSKLSTRMERSDMRPIANAGILVAVLALLVPRTVFAEDYITTTVQALQRASVYVVPGIEGTDKDTAAKLQTRLNSDDNIVLIMLPTAAEKELGADISTIAIRLSEQLGDQRIIGLAIGKKYVGYAPSLPSGVAADQMRRAESVSNDPVTALGTFAQNIHTWQRANPQPKPPVPLLPQSNSYLTLPIALAPVVIGVGAVAFIIRRRQMMAGSGTRRTRFNVPNPVKDLLTRIVQEREQVTDTELQDALYQLCAHIERYFRSSSNNKEGDALFFKDRLTEATHVLTKYLDVQENRLYYNQPDALLTMGKGALSDFRDYVLESIRRGNDASLADYQFDTDILKEHRRLAADPRDEFDRVLKEGDNG